MKAASVVCYRAFMLIPVLGLAMMHASDFDSGMDLYHACKVANKVFGDKDKSGGDIEFAQASDCISYVTGYLDGSSGDPSRNFCLSDHTFSVVIRVYVVYMDSHPKLLDSPRSIGLHAALTDQFPCPALK